MLGWHRKPKAAPQNAADVAPVKYLVGTGAEGFRPEGFTTIDISPDHKPDIVANAAELPMIAAESADEFHASHVLEHFSYPRCLLVIAEWARVLKVGGTLKIAVPDMEAYAYRILNGDDPHNAIMAIYGAHWYGEGGNGEGGPQGHHFGYTRKTLVQVLTIMGFDDFGFWRSDVAGEAANTWYYGEGQEQVGLSLNIAAVKKSPPLFDPQELYERIRIHEMDTPFMVTIRKLLLEKNQLSGLPEIDAMLFQKLNHQYLEAMHMWKHLEEECAQLRRKK